MIKQCVLQMRSVLRPSLSKLSMSVLSENKIRLIEEGLEGVKREEEQWKWTEVDQEKEQRRLLELNKVPECYTMPIEGVNVSLPEGLIPYDTQKRMMSNIIQTLDKPGQNAIIESPTGSGKTMSLLAAVCGWSRHCKEEQMRVEQEAIEKWRERREEPIMEMSAVAAAKEEEPEPECTHTEILKHSFKCRPVQIFYASRTHNQLDQVIEEFARLDHAPAMKHTILASKRHMCINEEALSGDVDEMCKKLNGISEEDLSDVVRLDSEVSEDLNILRGCEFKENLQVISNIQNIRDHLEEKGVDDAWNIAQLRIGCGEGERSNPQQICPYFAARTCLKDADIVFCPFNYLINPIIRAMSGINLKNAIVILDEAHNVENNCREAASFELKEESLFAALTNFKFKIMKLKLADIPEAELNSFLEDLQVVQSFIQKLYYWMKESSALLKEGGTINRGSEELWEIMEKNELLLYRGSEERRKLMAAIENVTLRNGDNTMAEFRPRGSSVIRNFDLFMSYLTERSITGEFANRDTYRLNVSVEKEENQNVVGNEQERKKKFEPMWRGMHVTINFWCMSAKLAFNESFGSCRNVILASGTLCPIQPLIQELGMDFDEKFRHVGEQVVPSDQIFAAALKKGPNDIPLYAVRDNLLRPEFQSEIGLIIKSACEIVPGGVLVFLPSYTSLDNIYKNMEDSGLMKYVSRFKRIVRETKNVTEFEKTSKDFEEGIKNPKSFGPECTGSLMFAVFRGKVSEGIDFKDDRGRCVISVGIPLPNLGDEKVKSKKEYNNMNAVSQGIPTGNEWYQAQAYRALNQALGRCMRHRGDWGAIVMVDARLAVTRHVTTRNGEKSAAQVSGWIRTPQRDYERYDNFESDLRGFVAKMKAKFG